MLLMPGQHDSTGIFAVMGPGITPGEQIEPAALYDILPTVYYLLGVPLPRYLEGSILPVFTQEELNETPPKYVEEELYIDPLPMNQDEADREGLQDQMRALGYLR